MKRLLLLSAALGAGFLFLTGPSAQAATYQFRDLSPSIPQKSGKFFDGVWNDGTNWLVTNGSLLYKVDGTTNAVENLTAEAQKFGMYKIVAAAPEAPGTWLVLGSHNGTDPQYASETSQDGTDIVLEEFVGESAQFINIPNGVHLTGWVQLKTYEGNIYFETSNQGTDDVYAFSNGQFTFIQPGTVKDAVMTNGIDQGRTWGIGFGELSFVPAASVTAARYGMTNPRDALLVDNARPDGEALLTGYGENGLRMVLAIPTQPGMLVDAPLTLTTTRVRGSSSSYVLTAKIDSVVPYIRILKNGIGIKKCGNGTLNIQTCMVTVDERGTADRYEAWAPSIIGTFNVTSKAIVLRDTSTITASSWNDGNTWDASNGTYAYRGAWSWLAPSSLNDESGDRVDWHVGLWREATLTQQATCLDPNHQSGSPYCTNLRVTKNTAGLTKLKQDTASVKAEIYVDGRLKQTCAPSADTISKNRTDLDSYWANSTTAKIVLSLDDCSVSITRSDDSSLFGSFSSWMLPGYVRIYAKFSWTELGQKHMMISPTDVVRFKPSI